MSALPPPAAFSLPARFTEWRQHQPAAILQILDAERRFTGLVMPTGGGKSICAVAAALISGKRLLYLTSSKGLQTQLLRDFASVGMVDVRGRNNYSCINSPGVNCDQGVCAAGVPCPDRGRCEYQRAVRRAAAAQMVVTNYSYWQSAMAAGVPLGRFDLLVADEAHGIDTGVSNHLQVELRKSDSLLYRWWPKSGLNTIEEWSSWAKGAGARLKPVSDLMAEELRDEEGGSPRRMREYLQLRGLAQTLEKLENAGAGWIVEVEDGGGGMRAGPVWPRTFTEGVLWRGVERVVLMSATLNRKTLGLLGIGDEDAVLTEYPHSFPIPWRRVWHVPTIRMNHRTSPEGLRLWVRRIDQIIGQRRDRNGIVHTVSYARRDMLLRDSEHRAIMMSHGKRDTEQRIADFKRRKHAPPAVLVSPSVSTGWDFPMQECEFQIIGKLPYPDTRDKLVAARCKGDEDYGAYVAMMDLVQASGRANRSEGDKCQTLIVDDNCAWFFYRYGYLAPKWFMQAYSRCRDIPDPLPKL